MGFFDTIFGSSEDREEKRRKEEERREELRQQKENEEWLKKSQEHFTKMAKNEIKHGKPISFDNMPPSRTERDIAGGK